MHKLLLQLPQLFDGFHSPLDELLAERTVLERFASFELLIVLNDCRDDRGFVHHTPPCGWFSKRILEKEHHLE